MPCPPFRYWLLALVVIVAVGSAYRLDGPDVLDAAQAVAEDKAAAERTTVSDADFEQRSRAECTRRRGADAVFFMLPSGDYVCRLAPGRAT